MCELGPRGTGKSHIYKRIGLQVLASWVRICLTI
jgi:predicted ATP-dependent Lon-type protease